MDKDLQDALRARYNPDGSALRKLQLGLLDILVDFDQFARQHHIVYSISYGTLIGAVRHQGFIPWDDDADIMMTRDQWNNLRQFIKSDGQISETLYIRGTVRPEIHKAWKGIVDIFIYDYVPHNRCLDWIKTGTCMLLSILIKCKNRIISHYYKRPKPWFVFLPLALPFSMSTLVSWKERMSLWLSPKEMKPEDMVCLYRTGGPHDMLVRHEYGLLLGEPIEMNFEGHLLPVIPQYDAFLRVWYNDYMTLPERPVNLGRVTDETLCAIK